MLCVGKLDSYSANGQFFLTFCKHIVIAKRAAEQQSSGFEAGGGGHRTDAPQAARDAEGSQVKQRMASGDRWNIAGSDCIKRSCIRRHFQPACTQRAKFGFDNRIYHTQ